MLKYISKFNIYFYIIFSAMLIAYSNSSMSADRPLQIDIMGGNIQSMPIAISYFSSDGDIKKLNLHKNIPNLIANNLINSGLFKLLDRNAYMQNPEQLINPPKFRDWRIIDAQALITGKISKKDNNKISVSIELWDVYGEKRMFGLSLSSQSKSWRRISHIISDKIYERLTGEEGYFDTRIIYVAESGPKTQRVKKLAIMDQDGASNKYLTLGNELVLTPRFSPDGRMVTYMSYFKNLPRVYLLNIETGIQEVVGDFPGMTFAPRFSPDGRKVIMSFARDGNSDIYTMDIESRRVEQITSHPAIDTSPSFSPDGNYITFNSDRSGIQQIYTMRADGRSVKRISRGSGLYGTPVWSPRGDLIAFTKIHKGKFYIGVMRTDGTGERLLTENFYQEAPSWSPNGRVLIFYRETAGGRDGKGAGANLWSIDITGYNEIKIKTETDASDPSWSGLLSK